MHGRVLFLQVTYKKKIYIQRDIFYIFSIFCHTFQIHSTSLRSHFMLISSKQLNDTNKYISKSNIKFIQLRAANNNQNMSISFINKIFGFLLIRKRKTLSCILYFLQKNNQTSTYSEIKNKSHSPCLHANESTLPKRKSELTFLLKLLMKYVLLSARSLVVLFPTLKLTAYVANNMRMTRKREIRTEIKTLGYFIY